MPANKKYLTTSSWQRFAKISAGVIGGYLITVLIHLSFALWFPLHKEALITSIYTIFIIWTIFLIIPFLFKNGWKVWGLYLLICIILFVSFYFGKLENPFL